MSWTNLVKQAVGWAIKKAWLDAIIDNLNSLHSRDSNSILDNGSFELIDGDGNPVQWTFTPFGSPAGTLTIEDGSTGGGGTAIHGYRSAKITCNSSGGGGKLESAMKPIGPGLVEVVGHFRAAITAGAVAPHTQIKIRWFDEDESIVSETQIMSLSAVSLWRGLGMANKVAPAGARFYTVELQGGISGGTADGAVWFDGIELRNITPNAPYLSGAEYTQTSDSWSTKETISLFIPPDATTLSITCDVKQVGGATLAHYRFLLDGEAASDESTGNDTYTALTSSLTLDAADKGKLVTISLQLQNGITDDGTAHLRATSGPNGCETKIVIE